ncbi:MAG: hypothetical protein CSB44_10275 [Gammaproteobacteria bacterium]|nr:MAG: hypothetical protein CSB44_10275 [Gammaproteobacteria bacterium]
MLSMAVVGTAVAQPSVKDNVITWPDDGWYQVQIAGTVTEICQGGRSCEVPESGFYTVINLTTGQRWENVEVTVDGENHGTPDTVIVDGNTIRWPDDGWYQVQDADTYEQICGGTRKCEVADGRYIVINHTTGERWNPVVVGDEMVDEIVVDGNTIRWPDDGWYQVQDAGTYEQICGGTRECKVADGRYIVINHTTGQRWNPVVVGGESAGEIVVDGYTISWPDDGWYQVQRSSDYSEVCGGGSQCTVDEAGDYIVINHDTGMRTTVSIDTSTPSPDPNQGPMLDDDGRKWAVTPGQEETDPFSPDNLARTLTVLGRLDRDEIVTTLEDGVWALYKQFDAETSETELSMSCEPPESGSVQYMRSVDESALRQINAEDCRLDKVLYNADVVWSADKHDSNIEATTFEMDSAGVVRKWENAETHASRIARYTETRDGAIDFTLSGYDRCYADSPNATPPDRDCSGISIDALDIGSLHTLKVESGSCNADGIAQFGNGCHVMKVRDSAGSLLTLTPSKAADDAIQVQLLHDNGAKATITLINGEQFEFSNNW